LGEKPAMQIVAFVVPGNLNFAIAVVFAGDLRATCGFRPGIVR
jgi:hypothetical protein